jgi:hypothetical protein
MLYLRRRIETRIGRTVFRDYLGRERCTIIYCLYLRPGANKDVHDSFNRSSLIVDSIEILRS